MVFLPEACDYIGSSKEESLQLAEDLNGTFFTSVQKLAKDLNIWLSIGSMHRKVINFIDKTFNFSLMLKRLIRGYSTLILCLIIPGKLLAFMTKLTCLP